MLFKPHHNDHKFITKDNYEEFFILYIDNELVPEQVQMVEKFLEDHPGFKSELNILLSTKLQPEEFIMPAKEEFMSGNIYQSLINEELFLLIDNELTEQEKSLVEKELINKPASQKQYELLQKTKLDRSEIIICPRKELLFQHPSKRMSNNLIFSIAAAILLILYMGFLFILKKSGKELQSPVIVIHYNPDQKINKSALRPAISGYKYQSLAKNIRKKQLIPKLKFNKASNRHSPDSALFTVSNGDDKSKFERKKEIIVNKIITGSSEASNFNKQIVNNLLVTSPSVRRITKYQVPSEAHDITSALVSNDHKGSLKSLLRRATRLIEKRTGVDPANENNEILIGAVALKLK